MTLMVNQLIGFGAGGRELVESVLVHDVFTAASANLAGRTPDTAGTLWSEVLWEPSIGQFEVRSATGAARMTENGNVGEGVIATCTPQPTSPDVDVIIEPSTLPASTVRSVHALVRYQDRDNYIGMRIMDDATQLTRIYKIVSGTLTELGTSTNQVTAGDFWKLEVRGTTVKCYRDSGGGFVEEASGDTGGDLSAAGDSSWGQGAIPTTAYSGDSPVRSWEISSYKSSEWI